MLSVSECDVMCVSSDSERIFDPMIRLCGLFQRLQVDLERSASISSGLGSRVAQCSLNGLADFLYRYVGVRPPAECGPAV